MRINRWLVVIGICLGLIAVLGLIKFLQIRAAIEFGNSFPEASETVETVVTQTSKWQPMIDVVGEIRAKQQVEVRTESSGIISIVGFESGGQVSKGDVLLQLDTSEEQARLASIKPEIDLAKLEVERLAPLVKKQAVSQQVYDRAQVTLAVAKAQEAEVREAIANKTVLAPFSGSAGIHQFEPGQVVASNTLVTSLVGDLKSLWVDFYLPQKHANLEVGTQVYVAKQDNKKAVANATVIAVEPNVSSNSRTIKARAEFTNTIALKPGSIIRVTTPVGTLDNVISLPGTAIRRDGFGSYVFVLEKSDDGKVRANRRPVSIAEQNNTQVSVLEGLLPGERVAAMGSFKLREGIWVKYSDDQDAESTNENAIAPSSPAEPVEAKALPDVSDPIAPEALGTNDDIEAETSNSAAQD